LDTQFRKAYRQFTESPKIEPRQITPLSIELINISKRLSPSFEISNISLLVKAGEFFCLLGPSGSGKSTILGLIGGWEVPDSGQLLLGGINFNDSLSFERPIRTCFQKGGFLFPHMTVEENIGYALKLKRLDSITIEMRVKELMQQVGLNGLSNRNPSQLSGGEAQRVAIARAIADPQPVLLLDEIQTGQARKRE
jgi:spermidine/putrescine transport system ATP-binding protein